MVQKGKGKGKGKKNEDSKSKGKSKPKNNALKPKGRVAKEGKCSTTVRPDIRREITRFIWKI